jgi:hypothetical protein
MDDPFAALRRQAETKRDTAIKAARAEYRQAVVCIGRLKQQLERTGGNWTKPQRIIDLIAELAPDDRTFTVAELVEILIEREPGRRFYEPSIRSFCQRLERQGAFKRIRQTDGSVEWARAELDCEAVGAPSLVEMAVQALAKWGPLDERELVLRIRETGYRATEQPYRMLRSLRATLRRNPTLFVPSGKKWRGV